MTACVNRKHTKKVAAVVTASLVGALSLGVAPVAAMAEDTGIELQASDEANFSRGTVNYVNGKSGDHFEYTGYYTGLVPTSVTAVSGEEYDAIDFEYIKIDDSSNNVISNVSYKDAKGNVKQLRGESCGTRVSNPGTYAVVVKAVINGS